MHELKLGAKGPAVTNVQRTLNRFGARLPLSLLFCNHTFAALKEVQALLGVPQTGDYDANTENALFKRTGGSITKVLDEVPAEIRGKKPLPPAEVSE